MTPPFVRATWYGGQITDANGDVICHVPGEAEMQLLLNALNQQKLDPCVRLQICEDGVWAHFHVPGGVHWSMNLSVQGRMASLFGSQYREWATRKVPGCDEDPRSMCWGDDRV